MARAWGQEASELALMSKCYHMEEGIKTISRGFSENTLNQRMRWAQPTQGRCSLTMRVAPDSSGC